MQIRRMQNELNIYTKYNNSVCVYIHIGILTQDQAFENIHHNILLIFCVKL